MLQIENLSGSVFFNYFCSKVCFNSTEEAKVSAGFATLSHVALSLVAFLAYQTCINDARSPPCSVIYLCCKSCNLHSAIFNSHDLLTQIFNDKNLSLKIQPKASKQVQTLHSRQYCFLQGNNNHWCGFFPFPPEKLHQIC